MPVACRRKSLSCDNAGLRGSYGGIVNAPSAAVTRMAPADYCGNAVPHTQNGTLIDIVDVEGIQKQASKPGEMTFEAAWGPDGAVCVNQTRYADSVAGQGPILPSCWNDLPHCETPEEGAALGGKLANFSVQTERNFCQAPTRY